MQHKWGEVTTKENTYRFLPPLNNISVYFRTHKNYLTLEKKKEILLQLKNELDSNYIVEFHSTKKHHYLKITNLNKFNFLKIFSKKHEAYVLCNNEKTFTLAFSINEDLEDCFLLPTRFCEIKENETLCPIIQPNYSGEYKIFMGMLAYRIQLFLKPNSIKFIMGLGESF